MNDVTVATIHADVYETILTGIEQRIYNKHRYSPDTDYIRRILDNTVKGEASWFRQLHCDTDAYNKAMEYLLSEECKKDHGMA